MDLDTLLLTLSLLLTLAIYLVYYLNQKNYLEKFRKINYVEENCQCIPDHNAKCSMQGQLVHLTGPVSLGHCTDHQTSMVFKDLLFCERVIETYQY